jgi:hypothetical protein
LCVAGVGSQFTAVAPRSQVRKTFSGKLSGHQDDTAVALQIALLSSKIFYQSDRYATYRQQDWSGDWSKRLRVS